MEERSLNKIRWCLKVSIYFKEHFKLIFYTWLNFPGDKVMIFSFQNINHDQTVMATKIDNWHMSLLNFCSF